jgi:hypothetical protein
MNKIYVHKISGKVIEMNTKTTEEKVIAEDVFEHIGVRKIW